MKSLLVVVLGLASGLWLSTAVAGCASEDCGNEPFREGLYVPDSTGRVESDYNFILDATIRTAVETFTRNGQQYRLEYGVTGDLTQ